MKITKARPLSRTHTETNGLLWALPSLSPDKATARANKIQAAMSLNAAAAMAVSPTRVVRSLSSAKIRASTGNAVMESATPMKTMNCANPTLSTPLTVLRRMMATPMPHMNGREIPATAMLNALLPLRRIEFKSSSRPTRKRKKRRPMLATDSRIGVLHDGKMRCIHNRNNHNWGMTPNHNNVAYRTATQPHLTVRERKRTTISAITLGWRRGLKRKERKRLIIRMKVVPAEWNKD
ncbi:hypothetical protein Lal_00032418 [Lupinus albus]|nr:hypothetical protein Lal_00032418 [Lupinus albus]